ncbi:MAG TPA: LacI family DNA-binding transcriptional regulator, partial [Phycisphaerales bacterium]|nr:LacI family DNA-binding transcriptional regulator [Phycisphaerales bacterium]
MPRRKTLSPFKTSTSIQDVARTAGVSTATVSRVLNTPDLVAAETAERVRKAVAELGYKPNL